MWKVLLAGAGGLVCMFAGATARGEGKIRQGEANTVAEWTFTSQHTIADPFNAVTVDAVFTAPDGKQVRVPAFWDGGQTWRLRYASAQLGRHRFRTECSDPTDTGLQGVTGTLTVVPYRSDNPLYRHGPVRVAQDRRHFEYADGTPFMWLGDTWWMGLCNRLNWPEDFQALTADRKAKGFNVIQIVAGLYPEMPPLDPRGVNEAGLPWENDFSRIRPEYFDAADRRLRYLIEAGLTPCIVGAWGYFLPVMGADRLKQHWRYLIARYGAYPVLWCVAGEVNLPYYKAPGFPYDDRDQVRGWTAVCRYVRETDPFHRPLTVHPTGLGRLTARGATDDLALLDYDMLQTGHGGMGDLALTINTVHASYAAAPALPVVEGEVNYEAILGPDSNNAAVQRLFIWSCLLSGAVGYTYGGNGIWQVNLEGKPQITFGNYPTPTWNQAMHLPGSGQVGLAARLLSRYPWSHFEPHPEWAALTADPPLRLDGCDWIWYPEGNPAQDAPTEKRFFRRAFALPAGKVIAKARLKVSADDAFTAYLNGHELGSHADWQTGKQFTGIERLLKAGKNVLAIAAENLKAPVPQNPAGLIAKLEIRFADGSATTLVSDSAWRAAKQAASGWREVGFEDAAWAPAMVVAPYGHGPWGQAGSAETPPAAYCAGIPGKVRILYMPIADRITVQHLEPGVRYAAAWFDPITGRSFEAGVASAGKEGLWLSPPPPKPDQDWALVLRGAGE